MNRRIFLKNTAYKANVYTDTVKRFDSACECNNAITLRARVEY